MEPKAKECKRPAKARKTGKQILPWSLQKEQHPDDTLTITSKFQITSKFLLL
jgi:hypothetical protein